ncbi:SEC-C motif domain protein [Alkaliphilus metalliredigens QYMF]|uniref:SEC-C motif domain protein n=1 Tax=Alkaliphilus metalliredigens (strain QYMF) TaxID=293826 RepID=A6TX02_ALKMQ|nr:SEC-C metal-binding domain-containing protein [Alkaliphilus metalliredigens]ABR50720.1 SEC-C motif domain protein [Alkaliphilus metalliredigens QYMF]
MSLYNEWKSMAYDIPNDQMAVQFWNEYCDLEKGIYITVLEEGTGKVEGKINDLAKKFKVKTVDFVGFLDGINDSLVTNLDLDEITEETEVAVDVDFEKLYFNMLSAKADWLYTLDQWADILTEEKRKEIKKEYNISRTVVKEDKIGRNEPCPCGSGKKYKKCCGNE